MQSEIIDLRIRRDAALKQVWGLPAISPGLARVLSNGELERSNRRTTLQAMLEIPTSDVLCAKKGPSESRPSTTADITPSTPRDSALSPKQPPWGAQVHPHRQYQPSSLLSFDLHLDFTKFHPALPQLIPA
ncbi:uncharacterized protein PADG_03543 [Paracoccidioides brasiliensis Pb18]|uniref:Uncharacterized protein n=1 Tax=Paracoccidioides brasiliensis (strain Pb18) TaxID=502780 RepID=C1G8F7_PARBD|nr:uncharacterized protein PADG_03543 [Paracoccidioides brasiliensis Pb18]EEH47459.1 hypothetical protein PADG_03543 [Paracoccidioides brasiliensis Pb18]